MERSMYLLNQFWRNLEKMQFSSFLIAVNENLSDACPEFTIIR